MGRRERDGDGADGQKGPGPRRPPGTKKRPGLSPQEREFAKRFVLGDERGQNRHNATAAARGAGYKNGPGLFTTASRLLRRAKVRELIDELERKRDAKLESKRDQVLAELHNLALARLSRVQNDDGSLKPLSEWPEAEKAALTSLEVKEVLGRPITVDDGATITPVIARKVKARMDSKLGALNTVAEHHGLIRSKSDPVGLSFRLEDLIMAARKRLELEQLERDRARGAG